MRIVNYLAVMVIAMGLGLFVANMAKGVITAGFAKGVANLESPASP